jgi:predicted SAM-dependent methyltransferase
MIAPNNPAIDVDDLMERVRDEAAAIRNRIAERVGEPAATQVERVLDVGLSRDTAIAQLVEDAARNSRPRTAIPKRLSRMPWRLAQPLVRFCLRILNYALKDQRHVNTATQQALRELLRLVTGIGGNVAQMAALAPDQQNSLRDIASLEARMTASEQCSSEVFERYGSGSALLERLSARVQALEEALTLNAARIDQLESSGPNRSPRDLDPELVNARLLAVEVAHTIAAQRFERLEAFYAQANVTTSAVSDTRRELGIERERALRNEASLRSELTGNLNTLRALIAHPPALAAVDNVESGTLGADSRYANVYLAIADRFRGDSTEVKEQLERYLSIVRDNGTVSEANPLVDIGSGRAEWLSICRESNIPAYGIETNGELVARSTADALAVREGDALALLRSVDDSAVGAITAFHVIEHLSFEYLLELFDESLRVLVPGGLMICETPNPANVTIGSCNFYIDPTHNHPLPSALIAFLLEFRGFTDVQVIELQPNDTMRVTEDTEAARRLNGFFYNAQNYATIARKPGAVS